LDLAHQKNLTSMEVDLLQFPTKENEHTAICRATSKTANGGLFIDVGDANPMNCNSKVARHIIRMASTRAKARCLRDLTNIGMTCLEELGDITEVIGAEDEAGRTAQVKKDNIRKFAPKQAKPVQPVNSEGRKPDNEYPLSPSTGTSLCLISSAAFLVKVNPRIFSGGTPCSMTNIPILSIMVFVLPLPGTAMTAAIPFTNVAALCCSLFKPDNVIHLHSLFNDSDCHVNPKHDCHGLINLIAALITQDELFEQLLLFMEIASQKPDDFLT